MKLFKQLAINGALLALLAVGVHADPESRIDFTRPLGMGGAFTAVADDVSALSYNPAGLVQRTGGEFTLLEIAPGVAEGTLDVADFIKDNEDDLTNWENLTPAKQASLVNEIIDNIAPLDPRVNVTGALASYVSGPTFLGLPFHVGYGLLGVVDSSVKMDVEVGIPIISYEINNDIVAPLSLAKKFDLPLLGQTGLGVTGKLISRRQVSQRRLTVFELEDLETPPVAEGFGYGMDFGSLLQPSDRLNLALMVKDMFGTKISYDSVSAEKGFPAQPSRDTVIRPRTNIGFSYVPKKLLWLLGTSDRWTFTGDIRDIFGTKNEHVFFQQGLTKPFGDDLWERVHLGGEFRWAILRFRGGAHQGYPAYGLGVDLPMIKLDYAFYGRELGAQAGDVRQDNHQISLSLRFGSTNTESHERIGRAKRMKKESKMADPASGGEEEVPQ